jgi:uncharacterized RDD family membrane protein YckC
VGARSGPSPAPRDTLGRPLASWIKRALAFGVDFALIFFVLQIFGGAVFPSVFSPAPNQVAPTSTLLSFYGVAVVVWIGYQALLASSRRGQTVGMMLYGLSVRDARSGGQVRVGRATLRALVQLCLLIFVIDVIWPVWDPKRQALHDKAAKTVVVDIRMPATAERLSAGGR